MKNLTFIEVRRDFYLFPLFFWTQRNQVSFAT